MAGVTGPRYRTREELSCVKCKAGQARKSPTARCVSNMATFSLQMVELLCAHVENVVWAHHERFPLGFSRW